MNLLSNFEQCLLCGAYLSNIIVIFINFLVILIQRTLTFDDQSKIKLCYDKALSGHEVTWVPRCLAPAKFLDSNVWHPLILAISLFNVVLHP